MGYAVIMFVIMLLLAVSIALSANYGSSKDSQEAPLLAENAYAERALAHAQTDIVVSATKVNGTMAYTAYDLAKSPYTVNLHLTIKNNGSNILYPYRYSIVFNNTWAWINYSSDNSTPPMASSNISSISLDQKAHSLLVSSETGVKIIVPSAPKLIFIDSSIGSKCYYNISMAWESSKPGWNPYTGEVWPIKYYAVYYTDNADIFDKNNATVGFTWNTSHFMGNVFQKPGGGKDCTNATGESQVYIWVSALDTHGNEGVPSNTCQAQGASNVTNCPNYY